MEEWLDRLAGELGVGGLTPEELGAVLKLAREVAHGIERRFAPVSAFLVGVSVGQRAATGDGRGEALEAAVRTTRRLVESGGGPARGAS